MKTTWLVAAFAMFAAACGTYSAVRPARTLRPGHVEVAGGLAASTLGEVNSIAHGAVGIADRLEVLAQNEVLNTFGELRFAIINPDLEHHAPFGLVVGAGGGRAVTLLSALDQAGDHDTYDGGVGTVSLAAGLNGQRVSLTLAHRSFFFAGGYLAASTRLAVRLRVAGDLGVFLEGGGTVHAVLDNLTDTAFFIGEGAAGLWLGF